MTQRTQDPLTRTQGDFRHLFSFKKIPTFMGVAETTELAKDDVLADVHWSISTQSGVVLLNPLVPLEYIYRHQHNAVVGGIWKRHHNEFANIVASHVPAEAHILEIGGAHGYLAAKLLFSEAVKRWTMVDPNPVSTFAIPGMDIIQSYIEDIDVLPFDVDAIVHSHTLEHMYDPARFFSIIRKLLAPGKLHIFSVPNLCALVRDGQPSLHLEHTMLLCEAHIDWLLGCHGFEILKKTHFLRIHSIFYVTRVSPNKIRAPLLPILYAENLHIVSRWYDCISEDARAFTALLSEDKHRNFIYAAHVATQYLLAAGLPENRFQGVLDNNVDKIGKRLYGHRLWVSSPSVISGIDRPVVILRSGVYDREISAQLLQLNPTVVIVRSENRTGPSSAAAQVHQNRPGLARTAALFYGQIRTGARTKLLHSQKRFMHLGGSFLDVFYHVVICDYDPSPFTSKTESAGCINQADIKRIRSTWGDSLVSFIALNSSHETDPPPNSCSLAPLSRGRFYHKWAHWKLGMEYIKRHETVRKMDYDVIIFTRPDLHFHNHFPFGYDDVLKKPGMWSNLKNKKGGLQVSDGVFVADRSSAATIANISQSYFDCWTADALAPHGNVAGYIAENTHILMHLWLTKMHVPIHHSEQAMISEIGNHHSLSHVVRSWEQ